MPAAGLTYRLGRGAVVLRPDGTIASVRPGGDGSASYLAAAGRVRVLVDGTAVAWPEPAVAADVDELELDHGTAQGLGLVVRHAFTADWALRIAFANHTLDPLTVDAELTWTPAAGHPAWVLAAGATGAYAIPGPDGQGRLLGGELVLGTCEAITETGIGLGAFPLGPLERRVVQWRWSWYAGPRTFNRGRFPAVPRDLVLPEHEAARVEADEDTAVVAPGVDTVRRGPHLELAAPGGHRARVEVRSRRGLTAFDLEWVEPLDEALTALGDRLLAGPRTRAGVVALPGVDAALVLQHLLTRGRAADPDEADEALGLYLARAEGGPAEDGRAVALTCGESERTGEAELLEQATAQLLGLARPRPGLGLAAASVCVARLSRGWPLDPVLEHLGRLGPVPDQGLESVAAELELGLTVGLRPSGAEAGRPRDDAVRRIGAALGAGLRGRPLRPLPVHQQAHLAVVLGLLPEEVAARSVPEWGPAPQDVARRAQAQVLARLTGQPAGAAHGWLVMGARLA